MHAHHPEPGSLRILVVDDNVDVADTMSMLLRLYGHRTDTANNGLEAISAASREHYDVVLLDLNMPIMDGFTAARIFGRLVPAPKLIALSACDDAETRRLTSELGFCAHLAKPVMLDVLQHTLAQHCRAACAPSCNDRWPAQDRGVTDSRSFTPASRPH